jgi:hypothetical protein
MKQQLSMLQKASAAHAALQGMQQPHASATSTQPKLKKRRLLAAACSDETSSPQESSSSNGSSSGSGTAAASASQVSSSHPRKPGPKHQRLSYPTVLAMHDALGKLPPERQRGAFEIIVRNNTQANSGPCAAGEEIEVRPCYSAIHHFQGLAHVFSLYVHFFSLRRWTCVR